MSWQFTPYLLPLLTSAILPCLLALFALRRRGAAGARAFVCLMLAVAAWSVVYMLEVISPDFQTELMWHRWAFVVGDLVPPTWLMFAAQYAAGSGRQYANGRRIALLCIVPLISLTLIVTGDPFGLLWSSFWQDPSAPFLAVRGEPGPWFWLDLIGAYVEVLAAVAILAWSLFRSRRLYRQQITMFLVGIVVPWAADLATAFGIGPLPGLDLTPMACTATSVVFAWGMFRFHFLDSMPIARDLVFEGLADPVVVVDSLGRVVDLNSAAARFLEMPGSEATGRLAQDILQNWPELVARLQADDGRHADQILEIQSRGQSFDVRVSGLRKGRTSGAGRLVVLRDITDRKGLEQRLAQQAFQDALTGLANRARFHECLASALTDTQPAVLFLDLDDFKTVNDTLGHAAGDELLIQVARNVERCLRSNEVAARLGGDEFAILAPTIDDAHAVAARILDVLNVPLRVAGRELRVRTSIGMAMAATSDSGPDDVLRKADLALYAAKAAGKSRLAVFDPSLERVALQRLELESDLRRALQEGEFRVFYQPIISVADGEVVELEALVRWQHPTSGLISPDVFIPLAEQTGMIVPLGQVVLDAACRQLRQWQLRYPSARHVSVAVNLSARQFQHPGLVADIEAALCESMLHPRSLRLEITETAAMQDADATARTLDQLKLLGVSIAIDDFGTGYSSLSYLKRFPVDSLKIDRSFVDGLGEDSQDTAIVRTIVALARSLGVSVTAEGVETELQRREVGAMGCDRAQGYLFARPLPAEDVPNLFFESRELAA